MRTGLTHTELQGSFQQQWDRYVVRSWGKLMESLLGIASRVKSDLDAIDEEDFGYGEFFFDYWDEDGYSQRRLVPLKFITAREIGEVQQFALKFECAYVAKMCLELQAARQQLYLTRRNALQRQYRIAKLLLVVFGLALPYVVMKVFE